MIHRRVSISEYSDQQILAPVYDLIILIEFVCRESLATPTQEGRQSSRI